MLYGIVSFPPQLWVKMGFMNKRLMRLFASACMNFLYFFLSLSCDFLLTIKLCSSFFIRILYRFGLMIVLLASHIMDNLSFILIILNLLDLNTSDPEVLIWKSTAFVSRRFLFLINHLFPF